MVELVLKNDDLQTLFNKPFCNSTQQAVSYSLTDLQVWKYNKANEIGHRAKPPS